VEADIANENAEEANRALITNKHDKARLLHLHIDPSAAASWSKVLREKIGHNLMTMMVRVVQYVHLTLLPVCSIIPLTYMIMLASFPIELTRVGAIFQSLGWK